MRPTKTKEPEAPTFPGAFLPDGCWNPEAQLHHRGETDLLTRALVRERRFARLSPQEASLAVQASAHILAFPNWRQWEACTDWAMAWTSTSAEEAIKRAGETCSGEHHWCSGKWLPGSQSACKADSHRQRVSPEEVQKLLDELARTLGKAPSFAQGRGTLPVGLGGTQADERSPTWAKLGAKP